MGQIADVYQARGQLDEALRLRQGEELPVYERLGDERERVITLAKIAEVYQARGDLVEALRIVTDESLPVFERLGDQRQKARTLWCIAQIELQRQEIPCAVGRMSAAYDIFLRLGTPDGIAVVGLGLARIHLDAGRTEEARVLLLRSRDAFGIPLKSSSVVSRITEIVGHEASELSTAFGDVVGSRTGFHLGFDPGPFVAPSLQLEIRILGGAFQGFRQGTAEHRGCGGRRGSDLGDDLVQLTVRRRG